MSASVIPADMMVPASPSSSRRHVPDEPLRSPRRKSNNNRNKRLLSPRGAARSGRLLLKTASHSLRMKSNSRSPRAVTPRVDRCSNVLLWMEAVCPTEIISKVLAFSGPRMAFTLSKTCRFWNHVMDDESTWRTLCEDMYKWKDGDKLPASWKLYYKMNPCVPLDFPSLTSALAAATAHSTAPLTGNLRPADPRLQEQRRSIRVLLRPGKYIMREGIVVQSPPNVTITIETMDLPKNTKPSLFLVDTHVVGEPQTPSPAKRALLRAASIRNRMSCRSVSVINDVESLGESILEDHQEEDAPPQTPPLPVRAVLCMKTRRQNEPILRVRQGTIRLVNVGLLHNSNGVDIWNGNAAIQVQPPFGPDDRPMTNVPRPCAILDRVDVMSRTGRGIVNIDGGLIEVRSCYVHDCAATGIYVGGPGSDAIVERSDVVRNGGGNPNRRGVARGHSGIYLEQGNARVHDCNISRNSLSGISAVSVSNAILSLESSDLVANGNIQLEMPPNGTVARRQSLTRNNNVSSRGMARSRSGLAEDEDAESA